MSKSQPLSLSQANLLRSPSHGVLSQNPLDTRRTLKRKTPIFADVPIGDSDCSEILRLAIVQHIIFSVICDSIWQRFFSQYLFKHKRDRLSLEEISSRLGKEDEDIQHRWDTSTFKALDRLDADVDIGTQLDDLTALVTDSLLPLLERNKVHSFRDELKSVFAKAVDVGKLGERDESPVEFDRNPSPSYRNGWNEYVPEDHVPSEEVSMSVLSTSTSFSMETLCVRPRIYRRQGKPPPRHVLQSLTTYQQAKQTAN